MSQAKRLITIDISPATETHCGDDTASCRLWDPDSGYCAAFDARLAQRKGEFPLRLPECIAAEKGTGQC